MRRSKNIRIKKYTFVFIFIFFALILVLNSFINFHFLGKESIHADAERYSTASCLAFYPQDSKTLKEYVTKLCEDSPKNAIYDYLSIPYGDYLRIDYGKGEAFYIDKNHQDLEVGSISQRGKMIVSDYLRFQMKKEEKDYAYTAAFAQETYYQNLDLSNVQYRVVNEDLNIYFPKYDEEVLVPLKYIQQEVGLNLGLKNEAYIKPRYISNKRKLICFTFDDGPKISDSDPTSRFIVEELYKYDCSATFFLIGTSIGNRQLAFIEEAVGLGMEYGSHTQSHPHLPKLSSYEAREQIMIPYNDLYDGFGYTMRCYRPPYGERNPEADSDLALRAILWNVDSLDWRIRLNHEHDDAVAIIKENVISSANQNDVVLFHDIYRTSVDAASELLPYYLDQGYQVVAVSELMDILNYSGKVFSGN